MKNNKGFSILALLVVVSSLVLIGFVGWRVYDNRQSPKLTKSSEQAEVVEISEIQSLSDIDNAVDILETSDIDSSLDSSELDTDLSEF